MTDEYYKGEDEKAFHKSFYQMEDRVEKMFADYQEWLEKKKTKKQKENNNALGKGGDPSDPSSPSSSCSSESSINTSSNPKKQPKKAKSDLPYLKFDIKFDFSTYNGELNVNNINDWIRQIEVYFRIQKLSYEKEKIQLATFRLGGTTLIWW